MNGNVKAVPSKKRFHQPFKPKNEKSADPFGPAL
jgi:hypothetical protein